ncbi:MULTISPECIES: putative type VI secretion system effector [unclassified Acinetobacter]|uniref:putative type VI secretion system effector n=1 Tax=unclassified Acinetobacter TaxID=196816 RepID=UPI00211EE0A4|nr:MULTISPECIES: putative type VI secretion system effector [unclassified Acinetobacter]
MKMIKIEGRINNLEVENSKILSIGNLGKHAANTSLIGTLAGSTSLMSNAPIMALAAKGRDGKTFRGEVNGIRVVGQFTGVKFKNNTPLIMVISEEQEEGYHFVYAALDPKKGLLHMPYEMGRSKNKTYLSLFKTATIMSIVFCILFSFIIIFQYFNIDDISTDRIKFNIFIFYSVSFLFSFFLMFCFLLGKNNLRELAQISENVFEQLNFSDVKEQDLYKSRLIDSEGFYPSVMKYRDVLIGKDPFPEDYFDTKNEKN